MEMTSTLLIGQQAEGIMKGMWKYLTIAIIFLALSLSANAQILNDTKQLLNKQPTVFIENKGQWPSEVKYLARTGGMNAWVTDKGIVYDFQKTINHNDADKNKNKLHAMNDKEGQKRRNLEFDRHLVRMNLEGSSQDINATGIDQQKGYHNYFIGSDQSKWATDVPLYSEVKIENVYDGIDALPDPAYQA